MRTHVTKLISFAYPTFDVAVPAHLLLNHSSVSRKQEAPGLEVSGRGFLFCGSKQGRRCRAIPKLILAHLDGAPMRGDEMPRLRIMGPIL